MKNNNPSEEVRRNVLAAALNVYENRVYDPAYKNSFRPRLEADMSHLLQTSNFEQEVDEHLRSIGIFPTAFEHEENRNVELRRLLAATFYALNDDQPLWMFQDVHPHGAAASAQIAPGDTLASIVAFCKPRTENRRQCQLAFQRMCGVSATALRFLYNCWFSGLSTRSTKARIVGLSCTRSICRGVPGFRCPQHRSAWWQHAHCSARALYTSHARP